MRGDIASIRYEIRRRVSAGYDVRNLNPGACIAFGRDLGYDGRMSDKHHSDRRAHPRRRSGSRNPSSVGKDRGEQDSGGRETRSTNLSAFIIIGAIIAGLIAFVQSAIGAQTS